MTHHSSETSTSSRTESEHPPARVLSANPRESSRRPRSPGFDAAELHGLVVVTTKRTEERGRGVYHRGRGNGEIVCRKTGGNDSKLLSDVTADPLLRPCAECYDVATGDLLADGGQYEEPDRTWVCSVCGTVLCAENRTRHLAEHHSVFGD